jgi:hypothetical protein
MTLRIEPPPAPRHTGKMWRSPTTPPKHSLSRPRITSRTLTIARSIRGLNTLERKRLFSSRHSLTAPNSGGIRLSHRRRCSLCGVYRHEGFWLAIFVAHAVDELRRRTSGTLVAAYDLVLRTDHGM